MSSGIYCHLPICKSRCIYCDFYSQTDMTIEDRLVVGILKEIELARNEDGELFVSTIYLGGGTPSCFKTTNLKKMLHFINNHFNGNHSNKVETTIEINPDDISDVKLREYKDAGINRISLGTQSFNDIELRFLGRRHTSRQNHRAIELIREAGFENYSLDLIFALPDQTIENFDFSLKQALNHHPAHISLYCLTYEDGTPLYDMLTAGSVKMLDDRIQADFFNLAMRRLSQEGYVQYELSNFAISGYECRHNLNYWKMGNYLGFGPSAHSYFRNYRWANYPDISKYLHSQENGLSSHHFREEISPEQRAEEFLMLSLRLREGVDLEKYQKLSGQDLLTSRQEIVSGLLDTGLAEIKGTYLRLTQRGKLVADEITSHLM
jgi:putative oxygen-independent coproporphyrinogen III oxidase